MAVKSVIDIEVNDEAFKRFFELHKKYGESLRGNSAAWKKVADEAHKVQIQLETGVTTLGEILEAHSRLAHLEESQESRTRRIAMSWQSIARNVTDTARTIFKWTALGTVTTGLLGAGSLWGLDRLAGSVSGGRRASLGLGLGYGQRQAFGVNFGRVVDTEGFLSGVNEALSDPSKRGSLYGAGVGESELAGKDTGQVGVLLLQRLKDLADRTPRGLLGPTIEARGLGQFGVTIQDLLRLKNTSREELGGYASQYGQDIGRLGLAEDTQRRWQDFYVQLGRAGERLENVFVRGLDKLLPSLTSLSDKFADFLQDFTESPKFKEWIDSFGAGLETFAKYIGSDKFRDNVTTFAEDVGILAHAIHRALGWLGLTGSPSPTGPHPQSPVGRPMTPGADILNWWMTPQTVPFRGLIRDQRVPFRGLIRQMPKSTDFNVGNIRNLNGGFMQYGSLDEGVNAIANLLLHGKYFHGKNTIRSIEETYSPSNENDTERLIKQMSRRTGFSADQPLDLTNRDVLAQIVSGITRQEGKAPQRPEVVLKILNQTGGAATISIANAAVP